MTNLEKRTYIIESEKQTLKVLIKGIKNQKRLIQEVRPRLRMLGMTKSQIETLVIGWIKEFTA